MSTRFEITDSPAAQRACLAGLALLVGGSLCAAVLLDGRMVLGAMSWVSLATLAAGVAALLAGSHQLARPLPEPRVLLRADAEGLLLDQAGREVRADWSQLTGLAVVRHGEGWALQLSLALAESDRIALRNIEGGFPRKPDGSVDLWVELGSRRRAVKALTEVERIAHGVRNEGRG